MTVRRCAVRRYCRTWCLYSDRLTGKGHRTCPRCQGNYYRGDKRRQGYFCQVPPTQCGPAPCRVGPALLKGYHPPHGVDIFSTGLQDVVAQSCGSLLPKHRGQTMRYTPPRQHYWTACPTNSPRLSCCCPYLDLSNWILVCHLDLINCLLIRHLDLV